MDASDSISPERLTEMLQEETAPTLLDIRSKPAYLAGAIPGSIHADVGQQLMAGDTSAFAELGMPADRPVVVVCAVGSRSRLAAAYLNAMGYEAYSLAGGMQAWNRRPGADHIAHQRSGALLPRLSV